jgi:hypothetical protein
MFGHLHARMLLDRRVLILALLALAAIALSVPRADATLSAVGPTSQATGGFPRYFTDVNNQRLELCLDQSGNCLATFPDPAAPPSLPDNFPDESFWFDATSDAPIPGPNGVPGEALLVMATEAAFANDVVDGDQIAFTRIRLRIRGGFPNQDYTLTYPYGSRKLRTDAKGGASFTSDVGCFTFPCDWSQVLRGEVGPWLKWDPAVAPAAPAGYLGDPNVIHKVVGSPTGRNFFRVNGGGNTGLPQPNNTSPGGVQNDLFAIQGKIDTGPDPAPPPAPAPAASFVPTSLSYAPRDVGTTSAAQRATLTNTGTAGMNISSVSLTGANAGDFAITTNDCGATLAANASCSATVTFSPTATGTRAANLTFADNAAGNPHSIALTGSGNGALAPIATLSPASMTFASQNTGTTSSAQTATMTNSGSAPMTVSAVALTGVHAADYSITADGCTGPLAVSASCNVAVAFKPTAAGTRTASLSFTDTAAGSPHSVALSGTGATPPTAPVVTLSASSLAFGSQNTGSTSPAQDVTLTNSGDATLNITSIAVTGADATDYARTTTCGATLAAAANCTISVRFSPSVEGARSAAVTIVSDTAASPHSVALTGTGVAPPVQSPAALVSPASLAFGDQVSGGVSAGKAVTVTNTGTANLVVGTTPIAGADFAKGATDTCSGQIVAPQASCSIDVRFVPVSTGAKTGTLTINDNSATSPHAVALSGNGTAPAAPVAFVSPASRTYAAQAVGTTSAAQTATMTNTGNAAMTLGVALAGTTPGDYAIASNSCGVTLAAGAVCTVGVTFKPTAAGARAAVLRFTDNSGNVVGSTQDVTLSGTGTAPAISATPNPVTFGTSKVGGLLGIGATTVSKTVSVTNGGSAPLSITTASIGAAASSSAPGDYTITSNTCQNTTRAVGSAGCSITIRFAARARGTRNAVLTINSNAPTGPLKVALGGTGG